MKVIYHSRRNFYKGRNIYWYEFVPIVDYTIPDSFIRVPYTIYYEFGGPHEEAIKELTKFGFQILEGNEI